MIDTATSWFEILELPVSQLSEHDISKGIEGCKGSLTHKQKKEPYLDEISVTVGSLINRTWFGHHPHSQYIVYNNGSEFKLHSKPSVNHMG